MTCWVCYCTAIDSPDRGEEMTISWFGGLTRHVLHPVFALALVTMGGQAHAGVADADVLEVRVIDSGDSGMTFHVTVSHPDTGWEDYCNGWDVVTGEGEVLKRSPTDRFTRLLLHPHENEQPFSRSQSGIRVPSGVTSLTIRAHDLVDGFGGKVVEIDLSTDNGDGYTIERP